MSITLPSYKAVGITATKDIVLGGITGANLSYALEGVTAIINTLGTRSMDDLNAIREAEYTNMLEVIKAAQAEGVKRLVL